jgi:aryl carrier-like protein
MQIALTLAQQISAFVAVPCAALILLTCGVQAANATNAGSDVSHGGVWGFARVLRIEHMTLCAQSIDVSRNERMVAVQRLVEDSTEVESLWRGDVHHQSRLRACVSPFSQKCLLAFGPYGITGGLGALGLRATTLLDDGGAPRIVLGSRTGRFRHAGHCIESVHSSIVVAVCDNIEASDSAAFLRVSRPACVVHAAGVLCDQMVRSVTATAITAVFAPKALAASNIKHAAANRSLDVMGMFSSIASAFGNIGQAGYSAANAYLDSRAKASRMHAIHDWSLQIPAVAGNGMSATTFDEQQLSEMGALSLDQFAANLQISLQRSRSGPEHVLALLMHRLPEAMRTCPALLEHASNHTQQEVEANASDHTQQEAEANMRSLTQDSVDSMLLRTVRELSGASTASLTAESPLMDAGIDSLAATELASRLRALSGLALSPTLVFEQPTPRAITSHLLRQVGEEAGTALSIAHVTAGAQASLAVDGKEARHLRLQVACGDAVGSVPVRRWRSADTDTTGVSGMQVACLRHGGCVVGEQLFDTRACGISASEAAYMGPQQRLLLGPCSSSLTGSNRGVFAGMELPDRALAPRTSIGSSMHSLTGDHVSMSSGRVSFALGLQGSCMSLDTSCSSALAASGTARLHALVRQRRGSALRGTTAHNVASQASSARSSHRSPALSYRVTHYHWRSACHPFVQRRLFSADNAWLYRSAAAGVLHSVVANHVVQGRVIFPGAAHLELAHTAAECVQASRALHDVFFLQPLAVEAADVHVECSVSASRFKVSSGVVSGVESSLVDAASHSCGSIVSQRRWHRVHYLIVRGWWCTTAAAPCALYDGFHAAGLEYGPGYRTLIQAWAGVGMATARLRGRSTQQGMQVHPADLDDALCLGGIITRSGETRLPFAIDDAQLQGASGRLWAVRVAC